jgi:hypothetical protein
VSFDENIPAPAALIRESIRQLRTLDCVSAQASLTVQMLDVVTTANGRYIQKGQGTPAARWDFEFESTELPTKLTQVFDGRFFYRIYQSGEKKTLSCVDLYHIPELPESQSPGVVGPTDWFGIGGLPTMLAQMTGAFDFSVVDVRQAGSDGNLMQLITIRGQWKTDSLRQFLRDQIDPAFLQPPVQWNQLPLQMPHEIEIVLGTDDYLKLFPYRITFRRNHRDGNGWVAESMFALQFHHVTKLETISHETFVVSSDDVQPQDLTDDFLGKVKALLVHPVN